MSKLIQILHSPFWGAAIVTIILLTTGDLKWWLFGLFFLTIQKLHQYEILFLMVMKAVNNKLLHHYVNFFF